MLYRNPTADTAFVPRRQPGPVHNSLAALLAWRYAQLLTALPRRDGEARQWQRHAELLTADTAFAGQLEHSFGDIESLKGRGEKPAGVFVHNALLRAIACERPFAEAVADSDAEHSDTGLKL